MFSVRCRGVGRYATAVDPGTVKQLRNTSEKGNRSLYCVLELLRFLLLPVLHLLPQPPSLFKWLTGHRIVRCKAHIADCTHRSHSTRYRRTPACSSTHRQRGAPPRGVQRRQVRHQLPGWVRPLLPMHVECLRLTSRSRLQTREHRYIPLALPLAIAQLMRQPPALHYA